MNANKPSRRISAPAGAFSLDNPARLKPGADDFLAIREQYLQRKSDPEHLAAGRFFSGPKG